MPHHTLESHPVLQTKLNIDASFTINSAKAIMRQLAEDMSDQQHRDWFHTLMAAVSLLLTVALKGTLKSLKDIH